MILTIHSSGMHTQMTTYSIVSQICMWNWRKPYCGNKVAGKSSTCVSISRLKQPTAIPPTGLANGGSNKTECFIRTSFQDWLLVVAEDFHSTWHCLLIGRMKLGCGAAKRVGGSPSSRWKSTDEDSMVKLCCIFQPVMRIFWAQSRDQRWLHRRPRQIRRHMAGTN